MSGVGRAWGIGVFLAVMGAATEGPAQSARLLYEQARAREERLRTAPAAPRADTIAGLIAAYERIVRQYPASPYSDDALFRAARLALDAVERFGAEREERRAVRLLRWLVTAYPASSLVPRAQARLAELERPRATRPAPRPAAADAAPVLDGPLAPAPRAPASAQKTEPLVVVRDVQRVRLPAVLRVVVTLDGPVEFQEQRLAEPDRVFFDLPRTTLAPHLVEAQVPFQDDLVRAIRIGRHPNHTTRIVIELDRLTRYTVFALSDPYRLIVDFEREPPTGRSPPLGKGASVPVSAAAGATPASASTPAGPGTPLGAPAPARSGSAASRTDATAAQAAGPLPVGAGPSAAAPSVMSAPAPDEAAPGARVARPETPPLHAAPTTARLPMPRPPAPTSGGKFSLARQLGLGVARIVIDPGHGGHDPGAQAFGLSEAALVLDIALRLERLLAARPGIEVVLTRRTDVFVPLEERTALANREGADLFVSIHVNASRHPSARGVETYVLNFATTPEAEAVAARENASSGQTMRNLPDLIKAIALNNKLDESREFAALVQRHLVQKLRPVHRGLRDLGVKQAPFVVLIGAMMPSVLAEISFVTNPAEARLLKAASYRQRIAEALGDAILRYQRSLKAVSTVARHE